MIRLIAVDLDNTLLHRDKSISEYTRGVFERVRERGILTCFATSRSEKASARFSGQIAPDLFISNRGALARRVGKTLDCFASLAMTDGEARRGGEVLYKRVIPKDTVTELLRALADNPDAAQVTMEAENGYFINVKPNEGWPGWVDYAHAVRTDFKEPMDYGDAYKLTVEIPNAEAAKALIARFPELSAVHFVGEDWYAFAATGVSKEAALAAVLEAVGISAEDVAAFGDDGMDAGMVALAGCGVAMGNAVGAVRQAARHVCGDCDADGVARFIEGHII